MRVVTRYQSIIGLFALVACWGCTPDGPRENVASALREKLGEAADPKVGFQPDSTHLLVHLATVAFPTVPENELTRRARAIASFAFRRYANASDADSVTVLYREAVRPGMWWIRHERTFSAETLRGVP